MKTFEFNEKITVLGVTFDGVEDIIHHAIKGTDKDGVYVGEDSERYPCFDSDDYATEDRFYWNFVFSTSKEEMLEKLSALKKMSQLQIDYNKLTSQFHPMAYWGGEAFKKVYLTEE